MRKKTYIPIGTKFGEWTVIGDAESNKFNNAQYMCLCSCGFTKPVATCYLKRGSSLRCRPCSIKHRTQKNRERYDKIKIGKTANNWTILEFMGTKNYRPIYKVKHVCGEEKIIADYTKLYRTACFPCKHLIPRLSYKNITYNSWKGLREIYIGKSPRFKKCYYDKGIKVCERWTNYYNFLEDMGPKKEREMLKRINKKKDFEPGNCIWQKIKDSTQ